MKIRKHTLWRVPVFCLIAGIAQHVISVFLLRTVFTSRQADGSYVTDGSYLPVVYAAIFVVTLFVGGLWFFRKMTKQEIAASAAILIAYGVALLVAEAIIVDPFSSLDTWRWFDYAASPFDWCVAIHYLPVQIAAPLWCFDLVQYLMVLLFVPFGRSRIPDAATAPAE